MGCRKLSYYEREGLEKNTFFSVVGSEKRETEHFFGVDYYPYGKVLREWNPQAEKYLTTHHERDTETGLDYRGARYYDADVARMLSLDPLAAEFASWSPYNYVLGNPLIFIDPSGRSPDMIQDEGNKKEEKKSGWNQNHLDLLETFGDNEGYSEIIGDKTGSSANDNRSGGDGDEGDGDKEEKNQQSGVGTSLFGGALSFGNNALDGSTFRFFNQNGTNFSPKLYSNGWIGGSRGRIKTYSAGKLATGLKIGGFGLGIWSATSIESQYQNRQINATQRGIEHGSNLISTFGGFYGAAWGIGWELGRTITNIPGYNENIRLPLQRFFGISSPEKKCQVCPLIK